MDKIRTQSAYAILEELISCQYFIHNWSDLVSLVDRMPLTASTGSTLDPCCWENWRAATRGKEYLTIKESYDGAVRFVTYYSCVLSPDTVDRLLEALSVQKWVKAIKECEPACV